MTLDELTAECKTLGQPAYRAGQLFAWLQQGVASFEEMTNLPKALRDKLLKNNYISVAYLEKQLVSAYDGTVKFLLRLPDGETVEAVLMKYKHGNSLCISTQAGCRMGCKFCATGLQGLSRNLTASEMLDQIHAAQRETGVRVSHLVLMGMGEPLDNYDNLLRFLRLVSCEEGLQIGMRHISLSTCGLVDKIYDLMEEKLQLTLSVSLHAPNDRIREQIMPIAHKYGVDELLKACRDYARVTGRRISFEYAMIDGVNDSDACARELAEKLKGMLCHVNLIPANAVRENSFVKSKLERLGRFSEILEKNRLNVTVRRTLGADIEASCGQLRGKKRENPESRTPEGAGLGMGRDEN